MKTIKLLLTILLISTLSYSQTSLSPGDIVITGFNSDVPDQITFVLLKDIVTGTAIKFSDNGWLVTGGFRVNEGGVTLEGTIEWIATSDLPCGTEITITSTGPLSASTTNGTVSVIDAGFDLATNGDQILAYQGTEASPSFLYGISFDSTGWSNATNNRTSALPPSLANGINAIVVGDADNGSYDCSVTADISLVLAAVSSVSNWITSNTPIVLGGCTYSCSVICTSSTTWTTTGWDNGLPNDLIEAILNADYDTNTASLSACKLTINAGIKLTIRGNDYVEVRSDITNEGEILIEDMGALVQKSNSAVFTNSSAVTNPIVVEKVTAPLVEWYEYTYWSSPLENVAIGDVLSTTSSFRLFEFIAANFSDTLKEDLNNNTLVAGRDDIDDNANDWAFISRTTVMEAGKGYSATLAPIDLAGPNGGTLGIKKNFEGSILNSGIINVAADRNDDDVTNSDNNWNLIGNPYASAIDAKLFLERNTYSATNTSGVLEGAIYFWSQVSPPSATTNGNEPLNFDVNDYAILNFTASTVGERYAPNDFIPSGQGFFVSFSNDFAGTSGDVIFTNEMRVTGNNDQFFRNQTVDNKLWLNLKSDNGVFSQIAVGYVSGATTINDGSLYDAERIFSGDSAMLYSTIQNDEDNYAIQGKAPEDLTINESIGLGITTAIDVPVVYSIGIDHLQGTFMEDETIYIKDNFAGTIHNLKISDYTFTSNVGIFKDRFEIIFNENEELFSNNIDALSNKLSIIELENDRIKFLLKSKNLIKTISITDLNGREIYNLSVNKKKYTNDFYNLQRLVYIAKVELSNGTIISKQFLKK